MHNYFIMNNNSKIQRRSTYRIPNIRRFKLVDEILDTDEDRVFFSGDPGQTHKSERKYSTRTAKNNYR